MNNTNTSGRTTQIIIVIVGIIVLIVVVFIGSSSTEEDSTSLGQENNIVAQQENNGEAQSVATSDLSRLAGLSFVDYGGNKVGLEQFSGKPLVINAWAVWCPFCREELADFAELQREFGDQVVVIAIDRKESLKKAKGFTDGIGITDDLLFLLDSKDSFYKSIGGFSMPETLFINSEGEIVVHKRGFMALDEMRDHTNKIISSNEVSL